VKHIISLGAGVQSSTMALMAKHGIIEPMPDAAIFADTFAELPEVYEWLRILSRQLPFPVYWVSAGDLEKRARTIRISGKGRKYCKSMIPAFTFDIEGNKGQIPRQCTTNFKIGPIRKEARHIAKVKRGEKKVVVIQWIGISIDEMRRAKKSKEPWCRFRYPLIEMEMTRQDCLNWMKEQGYPEPPRSSCYFCPFHSNTEWLRIKDKYPEYFQKAVNLERFYSEQKQRYGIRAFFHNSRVPLDQVDLRTDLEKGQLHLWDEDHSVLTLSAPSDLKIESEEN